MAIAAKAPNDALSGTAPQPRLVAPQMLSSAASQLRQAAS